MSLPKPSNQATVVVTGASSGIGTELARELARRDYPLVLVARRRERVDELANEVGRENSVAVEVMPLDLSDSRQNWRTGFAVNRLPACATAPVSAPAGSSTSCRSNARVKRSPSTRWR
jgi:NAD(P)-dependent dehydrogenase (short-subunit alcohol dehydrogenase family)